MKKVKEYIEVLLKILLFYMKRHPYITTWITIWAVVCIWNFVITASVFWTIWMIGMSLILIIPYKIYVFLDELSNQGAKERRKNKKEQTKRQLEVYIMNNGKFE